MQINFVTDNGSIETTKKGIQVLEMFEGRPEGALGGPLLQVPRPF